MADVRRLPGPNTDLWDWQMHGSCRDLDSALFFHPEGERGPSRERRENEAKAVCAGCAVVRECRAHALAVREPYGVWGGLSESERNQLLAGGGTDLATPRATAAVTTSRCGARLTGPLTGGATEHASRYDYSG